MADIDYRQNSRAEIDYRCISSEDVLQILEGKLEATTTQERPRRMWLNDIKQWTQLDTYEDIKRLAQDRCQWRACTAACHSSDPEDDS